MSKNLEYAIIIFLIGLLVILFRWSEGEQYKFYTSSPVAGYLINSNNGDVWLVVKGKTTQIRYHQYDD